MRTVTSHHYSLVISCDQPRSVERSRKTRRFEVIGLLPKDVSVFRVIAADKPIVFAETYRERLLTPDSVIGE